ncbi:MAG: DUF3800 domain-containing protein [Terracidiphilus sp.]
MEFKRKRTTPVGCQSGWSHLGRKLPTLHIHTDESGNYDFSQRGSRYYVFAAAWTYHPAPLAMGLTALRFEQIKAGHGEFLSSFHACEDSPWLRDRVISTLLNHASWSFAAMVVEKAKVNPTIYDPQAFYPKFLTMVLRFVLRGRVRPDTSQILIYTDTLPMTQKKQARSVQVAIKHSCQREQPQIPFHVLNHRRESNAWLQVADYCCWGVCRKWEHGNTDAYDRLKARLAATEIDPMSRGDGRMYY